MLVVTVLVESLVWVCLAAQVYHYLGYPVLLWILTRFRSRPAPHTEARPKLTLVIAAHNEEVVIGEKIRNSLALDYPDLEILVVEDGSTDATRETAERFADQGVIIMSSSERLGKAAALNEAVSHATGDIIVFSDANAMYDPGAIGRLVETLAGSEEIGLVSGAKTILKQGSASTVGAGEGFYWRYEDWIKRLESAAGSTTAVVGEMMAIRRSHFTPFPAGLVNDDAYLAMATLRRGCRVLYVPQAICRETPSAGMRHDAKRRVRMTAGRYQLFFTHRLMPWNRPLELFMLISHKLLRLLLVFFMAAGLGANAVAVILPAASPIMSLLLALQLAFYGLAAFGAALEAFRLRFRPAQMAWYITSGHISSLMGFFRFLGGGQSALWHKPAR